MNPNNNNQPPSSGSKPIPRLKSFRPTPDINTIPGASNVKPKKEFKPIVPVRKSSEDRLDSLISGPINDLIKDSFTPLSSLNQAKPKAGTAKHTQFRPNNNKRKFNTSSVNIPSGLPLVDNRGDGFDDEMKNTGNTNTAGKFDSKFLQQLFHDMEIDPMQPQHPTHLPLVDPRKVLKEYSLSDAKEDLEKRRKELEAKILNGELSDGTNFQIVDNGMLDQNGLPIAGVTKPNQNNFDKNQPFHTNGVFLNNNNLFFIQLPISLPSTATKPVFPTLQALIQANQPPPPPPQPQTKALPKQTLQPTSIFELEQQKREASVVKPPTSTEPIFNEKSFTPNIYPGDFPNTLKSLPSGKLGTLKIYKSGKTILQIGSTKFDVSASDKLKFLEELKCFTHVPHDDIEATQKSDPNYVPTPEQTRPSCYSLGIPVQHIVAAPIISKLNKNS